MTLTDAGPLIAIVDAGEPAHERCTAALAEIQLPMLTTWPAFTEAIYLLGRAAGWPAQEALWKMVRRDALVLYQLDEELTGRCAELMRAYREHPMDLADASLLAAAEAEDLRTVFTLDAHFRGYLLRGGRHLHVVPN